MRMEITRCVKICFYVSILSSVHKIYEYLRIIAARLKPLMDAVFQVNKDNLGLEVHEEIIYLLLKLKENAYLQ
jgi:hypothetical protein